MSERYQLHNMRGSDGPCECDDCIAERQPHCPECGGITAEGCGHIWHDSAPKGDGYKSVLEA